MGWGLRKQTFRVIVVDKLPILQDTTILKNSVKKCVMN